MPFPKDDAFWQSAADFIMEQWGPTARIVAPNEFMDLFHANFPYDILPRLAPEDLDCLVLHKGMLQDIDLPSLEPYLDKWKPVFANAVFVALATKKPLSRIFHKIEKKHVRKLRKRMDLLRLEAVRKKTPAPKTVILVTTYNRPGALRRALDNLVQLHKPILVVNDGSDLCWQAEYAEIQRSYPIQLIHLPENRGLPTALNCGLSHWLADPSVEWISYFQDDVEVRPDTLEVLSLFQDAERCPILTGRFSPLHKLVKEETRKGHTIFFLRSCPGIHLHAHRNYWEGVMPIPTPYLGAPKKDSPRPGRGADEDWWITSWSPNSIAKKGGSVCVVPGLVRTFSEGGADSTWNGEGVKDPELPSTDYPNHLSLHWWPLLARHFGQSIEADIHAHVPGERAELYHSRDSGSTEYEVLQFLASLICLFKPKTLLETGSFRGFGTLSLASGVAANGFGRLYSVESNIVNASDAKSLISAFDPRLMDRIEFIDAYSEDFISQYKGEPFDFCFLDTELNLRMSEFQSLRKHNLLAPGAVVVLHDTSRLRPESCLGGGASSYVDLDQLETLRDCFDILEFPYSRGFTLLRRR